MKFLKKVLPLCLLALALIVCVTLVAPKAEAATVESGTCGSNLTWTLDDAGTLTISGTGAMDSWASGGAVYLSMPWYNNRASVKNIIVNYGVTSIGGGSFYDCTSLQSVTIPDSVTSIDNGAFWGCTSLTSITIGDSVTSIGSDAFYYCESLTEVTIPASVKKIGSEAFLYCYSLKTVYYGGNQTQWSSISIGSYNTSLTKATIHYNHIHDYTLLPAVTVEPTCTQAGYIEYTCMYGETYREALPALGHDYSVVSGVVEPTCTEQGYTESTCSRCGVTNKTDYVPALGHDFSGTISTVEPTCTEQGYTQTQCIRCEATEKSGFTEAAGHKGVVIALKDATCTEQGVSKMGTMCERCGTVFVQPTYTPALGHDYAGGICTRCGEEATEPEVTEPTEPSVPVEPVAGTFVKITSADQLVSGQYVLVAGNGYAPTVLDGTWLGTGTPAVNGNTITAADAANYIWNITVDGTSVKLTDANGVTVAPKGGNNNGIKAADYNWDVLFADGTFQFAGVGEDTVKLACNSGAQGGNRFRAYKTTTLTGSYAHEYFSYFTLYKLEEGSSEPEQVKGDLDGDNAVSNEDVLALLWYTLFPEENTISSNADFTGDGNVTNEDVLKLLWHCLFPEENPL